MAITQAYLVTTKNLSSVINSLVSAKAPDRLTNKFLEDLGFKSSNDRLYVGIFKALGLLDANGTPTQRYFEFLDQSQTGKVLAVGIQEAYEDLFNLNINANKLSVEEVKNKLKTITQGQKSDKVLALMASTFKALCEIADWTKPSSIRNDLDINNRKNDEPLQANMQKESPLVQSPVETISPELHYNIQIHLPETTNMAVYDAIFQSLRKHIM